MIPQANSLVKFSTPVLLSVSTKKTVEPRIGDPRQLQQSHKTEDILGNILPPKQFKMDNGQLWVQTVLSTPATKTEVIQLQQQLDRRLVHRQAREIGICPVREELFEQCFDELIRQITIDCRQRGLLLVRVRDQYHSQISAYKTLYESSIAYGMRRVLCAEQYKSNLLNQIAKLERESEEKTRLVQELSDKIQMVKKKENERILQQRLQHSKEVAELKQKNQNLKQQIQNTLEKKL